LTWFKEGVDPVGIYGPVKQYIFGLVQTKKKFRYIHSPTVHSGKRYNTGEEKTTRKGEKNHARAERESLIGERGKMESRSVSET